MNQENNSERLATPVPESSIAHPLEQLQAASVYESAGAKVSEQSAAVSPVAPPLPFSSDAPGVAAPQVAVASSAPAVADDVDLIEKEWVEKAKELVARTRLDPYAQSSEMSRMKADYIKKRYNKDVKVSDK